MKKCISCGLTDSFTPLKKDKYDLFSCPNCGLIFLYPQPSLKELVSDFYSSKAGYHVSLPKHLDKIKRYKRKFKKVLQKLGQLGIEGNILDVGCSNGEFLFLAKKQGFKAYGVEVNEDTANIALQEGFNVFKGILEDAKFQNEFFSAIYLGDIVEHVLDPIGLIAECNRILKKGGILIIATPNRDCFFAESTYMINKWFGFPWSVLVPPYHLFIFSINNLNKIVSKMNFKEVAVYYKAPSLRHELGSAGFIKDLRQKRSIGRSLYSLLGIFGYLAIYVLNLFLRPFLKKDFGMIVFFEKN